jgi:hypothetical protein
VGFGISGVMLSGPNVSQMVVLVVVMMPIG